jgi:hypothetical protein
MLPSIWRVPSPTCAAGNEKARNSVLALRFFLSLESCAAPEYAKTHQTKTEQGQ